MGMKEKWWIGLDLPCQIIEYTHTARYIRWDDYSYMPRHPPPLPLHPISYENDAVTMVSFRRRIPLFVCRGVKCRRQRVRMWLAIRFPSPFPLYKCILKRWLNFIFIPYCEHQLFPCMMALARVVALLLGQEWFIQSRL